jgi:hypothetical protein
MTNSSFTVSWRDIAKKLNPLYEDQGYAPPSDVQMQNAVLKVASVLNAKKEKRSNRFYYESSFLDDAVEYILKNPSFKLHKSEKYEARNFAKRLTTAYLNVFDLLVASSASLGLNLEDEENIEFEKTGWFSPHTLFNFLICGDVFLFEEYQRETTLQRSLSKTIDDYSNYLLMMVSFENFSYELLKDFDHLLISDNKKNKPRELSVFYKITDFNKISQKLTKHLSLFVSLYENEDFIFKNGTFANTDKGNVLFSLYEESILDFVSNHKESSIQNGKDGKKVSYFKGDRYFWKQNL